VTELTVAGLPLEIGPRELVTDLEAEMLAELSARTERDSGAGGDPFRLRLRNRRAGCPVAASFADDGPATISTRGGLIRLTHRAFAADLEPHRGCGRLQRDPKDGFPLEVTLRVALCSRLPFIGGLPLHGAGVVIGGSGVVFFGPSGAGKSTIAAASPYPVLSDELVVAGTDPPTLSSAGFFATESDTFGRFDLRALVELEKSVGFSMTVLTPKEAFRRLLSVTMVPASSALWSPSMSVLTALIREVPVYRMAWSPREAPWAQITSRLDLAGATTAPDETRGHRQ